MRKIFFFFLEKLEVKTKIVEVLDDKNNKEKNIIPQWLSQLNEILLNVYYFY